MLQNAIDKVNELIAMDMGSLVEDKKDRMREKVRGICTSCARKADGAFISVNGLKRKYL